HTGYAWSKSIKLGRTKLGYVVTTRCRISFCDASSEGELTPRISNFPSV
ncbi:hypothetical protein M5D96_009803, partial [Drosophila gunungcola]